MTRWWAGLSRPRRRAYIVRAVAGALVLIAYAALAMAWVVHDETEDDAARPDRTAENSYIPEAEAGDGGTVDVVDVGFTPMLDVAADDMVSWAASVTNTSADWAVSVLLVVAARGEDGSPLETIGGAVETLLIHPGETVTVGSTDYVSDVVADTAVRIEQEQWWAPGQWEDTAGTTAFSEITTEVVGVGDRVPYWGEDVIGAVTDTDGRLRVSFRVDRDGPPLYGPGLSMIFRDKDGALLGASDPLRFRSRTVLPTGWSMRSIDIRDGVPQDTSLRNIELVVVRR